MVKRIVALGLAGAMAATMAAPSYAAPVPTATATVKAAAPDLTTSVRWVGRGWGGRWGGWGGRWGGWGVGAAALGVGLGIAAAGTWPGYYTCDPYYGYGCGYGYGYGYGYPAVAYGYGYPAYYGGYYGGPYWGGGWGGRRAYWGARRWGVVGVRHAYWRHRW